MIAQKSIAEALGMSAVTVSRALRNHPDLASDTRERILRKAREMGYFPSKKSREGQAFKRLGLLLYEKDQDQGQSWRSDAEPPRRIMAGLQREARRSNVELILEMIHSDEDIPAMIQQRSVDGLIIMGRYNPLVLERLRDLPSIAISSYVPSDWLPRVVTDNLRGMNQLTEHLISMGHEKILFLGAEDGGWSELHRQRARGYLIAMQSHGLTPNIAYCPNYDIAPYTETILRHSAIAASCDTLAYSIQDLLRENGKVIPRDCSLVGFDGAVLSEERGLTTYAPNWALMGKMAADLMVNCSGTLHKSGVEVVIPGSFIPRNSACAI